MEKNRDVIERNKKEKMKADSLAAFVVGSLYIRIRNLVLELHVDGSVMWRNERDGESKYQNGIYLQGERI